MTDLKTNLKVDHVYRVEGRTLQVGRSQRTERFEALRYVGEMVPYRNGRPDLTTRIEVFYSFAGRHHVLFNQGSFQAEELLS